MLNFPLKIHFWFIFGLFHPILAIFSLYNNFFVHFHSSLLLKNPFQPPWSFGLISTPLQVPNCFYPPGHRTLPSPLPTKSVPMYRFESYSRSTPTQPSIPKQPQPQTITNTPTFLPPQNHLQATTD